MNYLSEVELVAKAHRAEIEADLDLARHELRRNQKNGEELQRRVDVCLELLHLVDGRNSRESAGADLKLHEAMAQVIRKAPERMLRAGDLASEITRQRLYRMKDGRAVEPQQIHARVGNYPHLFEKRGTFITLKGE